MKISMILNEKEYIERVINEGRKKSDNFFVVTKLLCIYYSQEYGYTKNKVNKKLIEFYEKENNKFPDYYTLDMFNKYSRKHTNQRKLLEVNFIPIYKSEMEIIQELDNKINQRLLFTMMCLARYNNYLRCADYNYTNNDRYKIAKLAAIPGSKDEKMDRFGELIDLGLIYFSKKACNTRIDCMTDNFDQEIAIKITRIEDIANQYRLYCGEDYVYCEDCGLLFRNSSTKPAKKCPTCRKYDPAELRTFICADCGEEFLSNCRGNIPVRCHTCRVEYKKLKYKHVESKIIVCEDCGKEFSSEYRGNAPTKCQECREKYISEYKKLKYKPVGKKTLICIDCGKEFKGKRGLRCEECKKEKIKLNKRKSANKIRN